MVRVVKRSVLHGLTNTGTIELTDTISSYGAQLTVTSGTLVNAVGGTITTALGAGGTRTISAALNNQGPLNLLPPLTLRHPAARPAERGRNSTRPDTCNPTQHETILSFTK